MSRTQRIIVIIVVAFLLYSVIKYPDASAEKVRWLWDELLDALEAIGDFFGSVIDGGS
jgi:hypothetical protein